MWDSDGYRKYMIEKTGQRDYVYEAMHPEAKPKEPLSDKLIKWAVFAIFLIPLMLFAGFCMSSIRSCGDGREENRLRDLDMDAKYHPMAVPVVALNETCPPDGAQPWSNHNGDYKSCRKQLLADVERDYQGDTCPTALKMWIDADTLWVEGYYLKDYVNRDILRKSFSQQFKDCKFAKVNVMSINAGGQPYWTILGE